MSDWNDFRHKLIICQTNQYLKDFKEETSAVSRYFNRLPCMTFSCISA